MKEGAFVNVDNLRSVGVGMTKTQLYELLGAPHFNEGVFGVRKWNYIFDFRDADASGGYHTCQFQVAFDRKSIAQAFYWKPETCKSVMNEQLAASVPERSTLPSQPANQPVLSSKPVQLRADALFNFDSATLTPAGRHQLRRLLGQVKASGDVENIQVVGYTDRLGGDRYNRMLSQRRADAVRDYLVDGGVRSESIEAIGRGAADPLTSCRQIDEKALIACLASDRRVELSGVAFP